MYQFEKDQPALDPVIKSLLRTYEGIFDQPVSVNEQLIARKLNMEITELATNLNKLAACGIIAYYPQKDKPQLYFICNRIKSEALRINTERWNQLKEQYRKRVEAFIGYIRTADCRSQVIGNYFGDDAMKRCGVCDNCLKEKRDKISGDEFAAIEKFVLDLLTRHPVPARELMSHMNGVKKEKAWKVIEFLQAERKIIMNAEGIIHISK